MWTSLQVSTYGPHFLTPFSYLPADAFLHESWDLTASGLPESDPEVRRLLSAFKTAAPLSRAAGTLQTYAGPWSRFRAWCISKNTSYLPASPLTVSLYLTKLWETATSPSPVLTASGAIFFHHSLAGLPSPTEHHLVTMVREFTRRTRLAGQNKKNPFLASHIRRLVSLWADSGAPLNKLMMTTAVILCFAAFLRCDELLSLQWEQIRFVGQTHMGLFIEHQKTDQYRAGTWKIVARVGGPCCPVALVERLLDEGRYVFLGPGALIRSSVIFGSRQYIKRDQPCYDSSWLVQGRCSRSGTRSKEIWHSLGSPGRCDRRCRFRSP
jgi:hypothetical protein